jgi:hypothetical protein
MSQWGTPAWRTIGAEANAGQPYQQTRDPFEFTRIQAPYSADAYGLAAQMLRPGQDAAGGIRENNFLFTRPAQALNEMAGGAHPGESDEEFRNKLKGIGAAAAGQKAEVGSALGKFGDSVDPEAMVRASRGIRAGELAATEAAGTSRIAADREALQRAVTGLSPYMSAASTEQGRVSNEIGSLAGNIMGRGQWQFARGGQTGLGGLTSAYRGAYAPVRW